MFDFPEEGWNTSETEGRYLAIKAFDTSIERNINHKIKVICKSIQKEYNTCFLFKMKHDRI